MLAVEMDGKAEIPFIVLLGGGDCGLAVVRESLEATEAASTLLFRLKSPIFPGCEVTSPLGGGSTTN